MKHNCLDCLVSNGAVVILRKERHVWRCAMCNASFCLEEIPTNAECSHLPHRDYAGGLIDHELQASGEEVVWIYCIVCLQPFANRPVRLIRCPTCSRVLFFGEIRENVNIPSVDAFTIECFCGWRTDLVQSQFAY